MDNIYNSFDSAGKTKKNNGLTGGLAGVANKATQAPANKKTMPGLFPGGSDEGISFDASGRMNVSARKGRQFKSSESQTSTFEDFQKDKKQRNTLQQQMGGY